MLKQWLLSGERKKLFRWSGWFFSYTCLLMLIVSLQYLFAYSVPKDVIAVIYTIAAFISHIVSINFIFWIVIIIPLLVVMPVRKIIMPASILISSLLLSFILLDTLLFAENRFHINLLTLTILGWKTWGFGIIYLFIFSIFNFMVSGWIWKRFTEIKGGLPAFIIITTEIILLAFTHITHIWADACYFTPVTRFTNTLPLFYPATARSFLQNRGYINIEDNRKRNLVNAIKSQDGELVYPAKPLVYSRTDSFPNILIIAVDAMRADMIQRDIMPFLYELTDSSIYCTNHYSGGNSTRMGVFSMFYGLPVTYWQYFESNHKAPVLMNKIQQENFQTGIFCAIDLDKQSSLDRTVFVSIPDLRMRTVTKSQTPYSKDSAITDEWIKWLESRDKSKPFFGFIFYDSPPGVNFPPQYESQVTYPQNSTRDQKQFSKYKVSLRYVDSLIGMVFKNLVQNNLLDKTVLIITADHGQEFNENNSGFRGHGTGYSNYQVKVPLIIHWPGKKPVKIFKRTSHNDLVASLITYLFGCSNPSMDYCSGKELFSVEQWDWLIVGSYYNYAILQPDQIIVCYPGGYFEVRDTNYIVNSKMVLKQSMLSEALNETGRFFKK